jgi:hypothetical protein
MAKFCPECANPINDSNMQFCTKCGSKLPTNSPEIPSQPTKSTSQQPTQPSWYLPPVNSALKPPHQDGVQNQEITAKKRSPIGWIALFFGCVILFLCILAYTNGLSTGSSSSSSSGSQPISIPTLTTVQIKSQAQSISEATLMRNSEKYSNSLVYFRGSVVQVQNIEGNDYYLRIDTKQDPLFGYNGGTIYVDYNGDRLLEGDIVDVWGKFVGLKTYTAVLGNEITLPEINTLHLEMVKANGGVSTSTTISPISNSAPLSGPALSVKSFPGGAQIFLNGQFKGMTPLDGSQTLLTNVAPGEYAVELRLSGYVYYDETVQISSGQIQSIDAFLTHVPARDDS